MDERRRSGARRLNERLAAAVTALFLAAQLTACELPAPTATEAPSSTAAVAATPTPTAETSETKPPSTDAPNTPPPVTNSSPATSRSPAQTAQPSADPSPPAWPTTPPIDAEVTGYGILLGGIWTGNRVYHMTDGVLVDQTAHWDEVAERFVDLNDIYVPTDLGLKIVSIAQNGRLAWIISYLYTYIIDTETGTILFQGSRRDGSLSTDFSKRMYYDKYDNPDPDATRSF